MNWLDTLGARAREAIGRPDEPQPLQIVRADRPKPQIKTVWVQTARPQDGNAGAAEPGFYSVADDGVLTMHDAGGRPGKSRQLGPGDDAHGVAYRMAREACLSARGESNFNRRLDYPRGSFA